MKGRSERIEAETLLAQAGWVRELALHLVRDRERAEDLAQDAWAVALERPPLRSLTANPRAWLAGVLRNLARRERRDSILRARHERRAARAEAFSPEAAEARILLQRRLADAILALDEPYRSAITLRYLDELSPREVAQRQGITYDAARQRISRGIAMLRARLDRDDSGERGAWSVACLALLGRDAARPAPALPLPGGLAMSIQAKLAAGAIAAIAVAAFIYWQAERSAGQDREDGSSADHALLDEAGASTPAVRQRHEAPPLAAREAVSMEQAAPEPAPAVDRESDLHGWVLDPEGLPLAGAEVAVFRTVSREYNDFDHESEAVRAAATTADSAGFFSVKLPPGRPFDLEVRAPGCVPEPVANRYAGERVLVRMHRGAAITGRVTRGDDGSAVAGVRLTLQRPSGLRYRRTVVRTAVSGEDGRFRIGELAPIDVMLEAIDPHGLAPLQRPIDLAEGQEVALALVLETGTTVRGRVVDATTGAAIANAAVGRNWSPGEPVRTDANGEYAHPGCAHQGPIQLTARAEGYGQQHRMSPVPGQAVLPGSDPNRIDFELRPARQVRGRCLGPDLSPLEGVYVAVAAWAWEDGVQADWISTRSRADGTFELVDVRADLQHALVARKEGYGSLVHELPAGGGVPGLADLGDVVLAPMATVRGVVVDDAGRGVADETVELSGWNSDRLRYSASRIEILDGFLGLRTARTDDLGRFGFADLSAGDYEVRTRRPGPGPEWKRTITVAAGRPVAGVRLVLRGGLSIEGRVVDPEGRPVADVRVSVSPEVRDQVTWAKAQTDGEGRFSAGGLTPGSYEVRAWPPAPSAPNEGDLALAWGRAPGIQAGCRDLEIQLRRAATLRGRVVDADGQPVVHARLLVRHAGQLVPDVLGTDREGRFSVSVPEGEVVDLEARPPGVWMEVPEPGESPDDPHSVRLAKVAPGEADVVLRLPWRP